jgi:exosortase
MVPGPCFGQELSGNEIRNHKRCRSGWRQTNVSLLVARGTRTRRTPHDCARRIWAAFVKVKESSALDATRNNVSRYWLMFSVWIVLSSLFFAEPLIALIRLSLTNDNASYLILIPFLAAGLLFIARRATFSHPSFDASGSIFLFLSIIIGISVRLAGDKAPADLRLTGNVLAVILLWIAGFSFSFGKAAVKSAYFPLLFLFLTVPLPNFLVERIISLLQVGSAEITEVLFNLTGVPVLREGLVFHLARVDIEIARECSGIRSTIALFILALPVVHYGLRSLWRKLFFLICAFFVMILKNGIRIVTLSLLAVYVDPSFLFGRLHREGGIVFFLLGLLLLLPVLLLLQRGESAAGTKGLDDASSGQGY